MKILSIDVGMKCLAYCLFSLDGDKCTIDKWGILDLCNEYPFLHEHYGLAKNMGYGTKLHLDGIHEYGITRHHRRTFGCCKTSHMNELDVTMNNDD